MKTSDFCRALLGAALAAWLLSGDSVCAQTDESYAASTVRIGTWNLEHFGDRPGLPKRTPAQMMAIAKFITERNIDVLAVQEVRTQAAIEGLATNLGPTWRYLLGTSGGFRDGTGGIALGFLWNDQEVELVQAEELLQLPSEVDTLPIFHRKPISAVFRARQGGLDFRAITVHFKAGRKPKDIAKRKRETHTLRTHLKNLLSREGEDKDVLVLGDFNHTYGAPAFHSFAASNFLSYLPHEEPLQRTIVHFEDPIDHIATLAGLQQELVARQITVHNKQADRDLDAWRLTYSDHIPVTTDLRSGPDNDPSATFAPVLESQWLKAGGLAAQRRSKPSSPRPKPASRNGVASGTGVAPTNRGQRPTPSGAPLIPIGSRVQLIVDQAVGPQSGTLLSGVAGDWIYIRDNQGATVAFPRELVRRITMPAR